MAKSNMNVSDIVTVSDEAYAMIVSQLDMLSWIDKGNKQGEVQKDDSLNPKRNERNVDVEDDEESNSNLQAKYEKLYHELMERKKNDIEAWLSWDRGYKEKISLSLRQNSKNPSKNGNSGSRVQEFAMSNNEPEPEFEEW
jgi:hypothetical protein